MSANLFDTAPSTKPVRPTIFRRVLNAMVESRQRHAQFQINSYLLDLDDATLASYGYDRTQLLKDGTASRSF